MHRDRGVTLDSKTAAIQAGDEYGEQFDFADRPFFRLPQRLLVTARQMFAAKFAPVR